MRILALLIALASPARAEAPAVQFSPLRIEAAEEALARGWRVTAPVLSDGLVGRVCEVRFHLRQGEKRIDESRRRAISVPSWEESSFYKQSLLAQTFDPAQAVDVTFTLVDVVSQHELGSVSGTLPAASSLPLTIEKATVKQLGRVLYQGPIDLAPTWQRIQSGELRGVSFIDRRHLLPKKAKGYWREYVHPTPGARGDGPQRLIVGKDGQLFYTPDDHKSFVDLGIH